VTTWRNGSVEETTVAGDRMDRNVMQDLIGRYIAAYNRFDLDGMFALFTEDVHFENISDGQVTASTFGLAELRLLAEQSAVLFSEREQQITHIRFGDESAIAGIVFRGVLAADLPDGASVGETLKLVGESEFGFSGERISRIIDRS
jgi:ketosteroid isomerase-like protein